MQPEPFQPPAIMSAYSSESLCHGHLAQLKAQGALLALSCKALFCMKKVEECHIFGSRLCMPNTTRRACPESAAVFRCY